MVLEAPTPRVQPQDGVARLEEAEVIHRLAAATYLLDGHARIGVQSVSSVFDPGGGRGAYEIAATISQSSRLVCSDAVWPMRQRYL